MTTNDKSKLETAVDALARVMAATGTSTEAHHIARAALREIRPDHPAADPFAKINARLRDAFGGRRK